MDSVVFLVPNHHISEQLFDFFNVSDPFHLRLQDPALSKTAKNHRENIKLQKLILKNMDGRCRKLLEILTPK